MIVTIYTKPVCPHCTAAKAFLTKHDIPFKEKDVTDDDAALAFIKDKGHRTVPQLYVGNKLFVEGGNAGLQALKPFQLRARLMGDE